MPKRVIHHFDIDFDKLKVDQLYESLCGKRYIACEPPTAEECDEIQEKTKNDPHCKRCLKIKASRGES